MIFNGRKEKTKRPKKGRESEKLCIYFVFRSGGEMRPGVGCSCYCLSSRLAVVLHITSQRYFVRFLRSPFRNVFQASGHLLCVCRRVAYGFNRYLPRENYRPCDILVPPEFQRARVDFNLNLTPRRTSPCKTLVSIKMSSELS